MHKGPEAIAACQHKLQRLALRSQQLGATVGMLRSQAASVSATLASFAEMEAEAGAGAEEEEVDGVTATLERQLLGIESTLQQHAAQQIKLGTQERLLQAELRQMRTCFLRTSEDVSCAIQHLVSEQDAGHAPGSSEAEGAAQ